MLRKNNIPNQDFIDEQFDSQTGVELTDVMVILSTPRSGSTFLSDLIFKNEICLPHEYFQPFEYLPILAKRWNCIKNGKLDKKKYLDNLIKFRTSEKGWLGINLHGEHLQEFSQYRKLLPDVNYHYVYVFRENCILQAISYEMAMQTRKWSSHFDSTDQPFYNFHGIKRRLNILNHQNNLIMAFLSTNNIEFKSITFEKMISNPEPVLKGIVPKNFHNILNIETELKKQSSNLNKDWSKIFSKEYFKALSMRFSKAIFIKRLSAIIFILSLVKSR